MDSVKEPEPVVRRAEFKPRDQGQVTEKVDGLDEVGEAEQTSEGNKGRGKGKSVDYDDPVPRRTKKKAISI